MTRLRQSIVSRCLLGSLIGSLVSLAPAEVSAATLTAFSYDPTGSAVYYQFSTDMPFDAYRVIVRQVGGSVAGVRGAHVHGATTGMSGVVEPLNCGTQYRFILRIRWIHGGPWVTVRNFTFWTNPC